MPAREDLGGQGVAEAQAQMTPRQLAIVRSIEKAIRIIGFQSELARRIGYSHNAVYQARRRAIVSPQMAKAIEIATEGKVSMAKLCPNFSDAPRSTGANRRVIRQPIPKKRGATDARA